MPRPLRFIPCNGIVEVTTRTLQGRLLLRPSPKLNDLILGVVGRAQEMYGMIIHAFVFMSNHCHFLVAPTNAKQLSKFMQFVNSNVAREAARLHN
jgi:REP element-mobilizing transposase RayT